MSPCYTFHIHIVTPALLSDNAPLLPENCGNYKCFGIHMLCVCVYYTEHGEKKEEKHGQSQGYKSISRDLDVPVSTVRNIKELTAHGTVANLPGRGQKRKIATKDCSNGG